MITAMKKCKSKDAARGIYREKRRQGYNVTALMLNGQPTIVWSAGFINGYRMVKL